MSAVLETVAPITYRSAEPVIGFAAAEKLAKKYGTALLVVSRSALRRNYELFRRGLPGVEMFYAAKANPNIHILRTLAKAGSSVDVCSYRETLAALKAGFAPENMLHTHPCKTPDNLLNCYNKGVRWFVYDNAYEIPKFLRYARDAQLLLRLAVTSASSMINLSAKFGANPDDGANLILDAARKGLAVKGLSFHVGSQCLSPSDFRNALIQARRVWDEAADAGVQLEVLDIGGGFPAPYMTPVLTLESYLEEVNEALQSVFGDVPARIIAEPGRGMCADTTTLITKVIGTSMRNGLPWHMLDDGLYGSFSGVMFDHVEFPILARDMDERELRPCVLAGPTCDSSDVVCKTQPMPELEVGELLLVPTMGAYTSASACPFNGLDMARTISVE